MTWLISTVITGITAFAATNIDDIVILMIFFAQVNQRFRPRHIIAGQYLGFCTLLLISLPGFFGGFLVPRAWLGLLGLLPIAIGIKHLLHPEPHEDVQTVSDELSEATAKSVVATVFAKLLDRRVYQVAAVTIANGGDNVGIYLPLFAGITLPSLLIILAVFLAMVLVWCYLAYQFTSHPAIAPILTRYSRRVVPFVLIGLGLYILIESRLSP